MNENERGDLECLLKPINAASIELAEACSQTLAKNDVTVNETMKMGMRRTDEQQCRVKKQEN